MPGKKELHVFLRKRCSNRVEKLKTKRKQAIRAYIDSLEGTPLGELLGQARNTINMLDGVADALNQEGLTILYEKNVFDRIIEKSFIGERGWGDPNYPENSPIPAIRAPYDAQIEEAEQARRYLANLVDLAANAKAATQKLIDCGFTLAELEGVSDIKAVNIDALK